MAAGQKSGQPGYGWDDYLAALVAEHGTLAAVAWKLLDRAEGVDDVASVERALRRLRGRGQRDGGVWGQRLVRRFGVPLAVTACARWMGLYHSPFNDLPLSLCLDQLRLWDRPPVAESRARLWIELGYASCALRQRRHEAATAHADAVAATLAGSDAGEDAARIELALVRAYLASRAQRSDEVAQKLDTVAQLLDGASLAPDDAACFRARLVDQRAFQLNREHRADADAQALALYRSLPAEDVHPFASYRRDAGLAWGEFRAGRVADAVRLAERACAHAGDGGYTRLRAMGLLLQAKIVGAAAGTRAELLARASAIATRLEDAELLRRVEALHGRSDAPKD
jgi:hypothetical protein